MQEIEELRQSLSEAQAEIAAQVDVNNRLGGQLEEAQGVMRTLEVEIARLKDPWTPFEAAPKDGRKVILGRFTGNPEAMHEGLVKVDRYTQPEEGKGWVGYGRFNHTYWPPTHFMPIPAPPEKKES